MFVSLFDASAHLDAQANADVFDAVTLILTALTLAIYIVAVREGKKNGVDYGVEYGVDYCMCYVWCV